jgi:hypothetical protein
MPFDDYRVADDSWGIRAGASAPSRADELCGN